MKNPTNTTAAPKTPRQHAKDLRTEAERLEDLARQFRGAAYALDPRGRRPAGSSGRRKAATR